MDPMGDPGDGRFMNMPPSAHGMLGPGPMNAVNPYGPSGPLPPGLGAPAGSYPMPGMGGMGSKPLTQVQLQQLTAQIRAYRMLSRNLPPPDALMSIVQGRKIPPVSVMQQQQHQMVHGSYPTGVSSPKPGGGGGGGGPMSQPGHMPSQGSPGVGGVSSAPSSGGEYQQSSGGGAGGTNIGLYPPSPSLSQGALSAPGTPQSKTPVTMAPNVSLTAPVDPPPDLAKLGTQIGHPGSVTLQAFDQASMLQQQQQNQQQLLQRQQAQAGIGVGVGTPGQMLPVSQQLGYQPQPQPQSSSLSSSVAMGGGPGGAPPLPGQPPQAFGSGVAGSGGVAKPQQVPLKQVKLGQHTKVMGIDPITVIKERNAR